MNLSSVAVTVLVLAPILAGVVGLATGRRWPRSVVSVAVGGSTVAFGAAILLAIDQLAPDQLHSTGQVFVELSAAPTGTVPFTPALRADPLTATVAIMVTVVALSVQIYSIAYLRGDRRYSSYAAVISLFTAAMLLVVAADDLFVLLVGWEVMGICSYFLIAHHWELPEARAGAVKAFLMTRLGDVGFLFGIFVLGLSAGTFRISEVQAAVAAGQIGPATLTAATLLLLAGIVGKSAQFPLHTWLPDAMPGPTPISALIHAATMVAAGVVVIARLYGAFQAAPATMTVLAIIAAVTMLGAALFALAADDLKRVLAWSTVSQLAYMFAALAAGSYVAGLFHLLAHGAFKALLFLAAGSVIHAVGSNSMAAMGGLRRAMPVTFVTMTIGFASLAGVPGLAGFFSKDAVLGGLSEAAMHGAAQPGETVLPSAAVWILLASGVVTAAVTAGYCARAWLRVFFGRFAEEHEGALLPHEPSPLMLTPMVVLAVPAAGLGALAFWPDALARALVGDAAIGARAAELVHPGTAILTSALVVAAGLAAWVAWRRHAEFPNAGVPPWLTRPLRRELWIDAAYARGVVGPIDVAAHGATAGDRDVVMTYVQGAGASARGIGFLARRAQSGSSAAYLVGLALGVAAIGIATVAAVLGSLVLVG